MIHETQPPAASAPKRTDEESLALKLWVVLSRAKASVQKVAEADMARHNLSPGEFGILEVLYHKGPMLLGEVQKKVLVSSGGVTYLVDRLSEQKLVERRDCASDRRARYAALTPDGVALMEKIFPDHAKAIVCAVSSLSADEKREAIALMRKLGLSVGD